MKKHPHGDNYIAPELPLSGSSHLWAVSMAAQLRRMGISAWPKGFFGQWWIEIKDEELSGYTSQKSA